MLSAFGVVHEDLVSKAKLPVFHGTTKAGAKAIKEGKFVATVGRHPADNPDDILKQPHLDFRPEGIYTTPSSSIAAHYAKIGRSPAKRGMAGDKRPSTNPYKARGRILRWDAKGKKPLYASTPEIVFDPKDLGQPDKTIKIRDAVKAKAGGKKYAITDIKTGSTRKRRRGKVTFAALPRKKYEKYTSELGAFDRKQENKVAAVIQTQMATGKNMSNKKLKRKLRIKPKTKKRIMRLQRKAEKLERKSPFLEVKHNGKVLSESKNLHPKLRKKMLKQAKSIGAIEDRKSPRARKVMRSAKNAIVTPDPTVRSAFGVDQIMKKLQSALRGEKGVETMQRILNSNPEAKAAALGRIKELGTDPWDISGHTTSTLRAVNENYGEGPTYALSRLISHNRGVERGRLPKQHQARKEVKRAGKAAAGWRKEHFAQPEQGDGLTTLDREYWQRKHKMTPRFAAHIQSVAGGAS